MGQKLVQLDCFGVTDPGLKRSANQDQMLIADLRKSARVLQSSFVEKPRRRLSGPVNARLLAVADGMGGMAEGARASRIVIETFARHVVSKLAWVEGGKPDAPAIMDGLAKAAVRCRDRLLRQAGGAPARAMGSTLTAAYLVWPHLFVLHVGDSRCYVFSGGKLHQLTTDHSIAQRLSDEGAMDAQAAQNSPFAHVLWNSISNAPQSELKPQLVQRKLKADDVLVLSTDGLTRHVSDTEIAAVAAQETSAQTKAAQLVLRAREGGGADNITVIVAQSGA